MSLRTQLIAGAALALAVVAGAWWLHHDGYAQGRADEQTAANIAAAKQYEADVARINDSVGVLQARIEDLQNAKPKVITRYRDRVVKAPLPADCRIDDGRLHDIQAAINSASTAR